METKMSSEKGDSQTNLGGNSGNDIIEDNPKGDEYLELVRKLRLELSDKNNECELLRIKLSESSQDVENLGQELNQCKITMFENNEDSRKTHEEVMKYKKLEADYVKLMSDFLTLGEQTDNYKRELTDNYLAKTNAINNFECLKSSGALKYDYEACKQELDDKLVELNLTKAKLKHLEDDNTVKEKSISELRKTLEDAKITHKHEITVLEEFIQSLKNTITSYERALSSYIKAEPQEA